MSGVQPRMASRPELDAAQAACGFYSSRANGAPARQTSTQRHLALVLRHVAWLERNVSPVALADESDAELT